MVGVWRSVLFTTRGLEFTLSLSVLVANAFYPAHFLQSPFLQLPLKHRLQRCKNDSREVVPATNVNVQEHSTVRQLVALSDEQAFYSECNLQVHKIS